jgi:anti-sigma factor RsiW
MDCARVRAEGIAESYLLGRLAETERDDFEEHFLACNACFEELKSLQALQAELARTRAAVLREGDPRRQARWPWLLAAAAALVACVAGVVTWQRLHAPIDSSTTLAELARV